jgi:hypothetical protein
MVAVLFWISFLFILNPSEVWFPFIWDVFVNLFSFFSLPFIYFLLFCLDWMVIYDRLLKTQLRAGTWTNKLGTAFYCILCSLTTLEHSVQQEKLHESSKPTCSPPARSIPLYQPKCPSEGDICQKVPRTMSCSGSLCLTGTPIHLWPWSF